MNSSSQTPSTYFLFIEGMCNSKNKSMGMARIDGRPVLQPAGNRVVPSHTKKSLNLPTPPIKLSCREAPDKNIGMTAPAPSPRKPSPPLSPETKPALRRCSSFNLGHLAIDRTPSNTTVLTKSASMAMGKKPKKLDVVVPTPLAWSDGVPGSLAAAQREQASLVQAQRKMKIAHYGRTAPKLKGMKLPSQVSTALVPSSIEDNTKRCSFITSSSDPLYIQYHDQEWGVPVHDDKMLFELLVLTGEQVALDWTTILKKRNEFRQAFRGFDAEAVAQFSDKRIVAISSDYGLDLSRVRGAVNNSHRILEVRREFGTVDEYLWGFVSHKPIMTSYKACRKIPVKTSKSEAISKDLVRRGFRFVGPAVVHSFMQAAGLTNDHVVSCPRRAHCISIVT